MISNPGTYCVVSYEYFAIANGERSLADRRRLMEENYKCAIAVYMPQVISMVVAFIRRVRDMTNNDIKSLSTIFLVGHVVGGHAVGAVGSRLQQIFEKEKVGAVWGKL